MCCGVIVYYFVAWPTPVNSHSRAGRRLSPLSSDSNSISQLPSTRPSLVKAATRTPRRSNESYTEDFTQAALIELYYRGIYLRWLHSSQNNLSFLILSVTSLGIQGYGQEWERNPSHQNIPAILYSWVNPKDLFAKPMRCDTANEKMSQWLPSRSMEST